MGEKPDCSIDGDALVESRAKREIIPGQKS